MTILALTFPTGRFHATPWGRHVNEGAVEWPPSPWRILRTLVATWHLKASGIPEGEIVELVETLSSAPVFHLPKAATTAHTRHYMPYNEGKNQKTTKVFDTFINLNKTENLYIVWPEATTPAVLKKLTDQVNYFGRAESLAEISVCDKLPENIEVTHHKISPLTLQSDTQTTRVLCPMSPEAYQSWRQAQHPEPSGKPAKKKTKKAKITIPKTLLEALHADTGNLQKEGWNLPPATEFKTYTSPENFFETPHFRISRNEGLHFTVARYIVHSSVLPRLTKAVSVADRIHSSLVSHTNGASVFTGKDENRRSLTGHKHTHIFCEANGIDDRITHVTIYAKMAFDEHASKALRSLQKVWGHGGHDLHLVLTGLGIPDGFRDECPLFQTSDKWQSITPYISTHHAKTYSDGRPKIDPDNGWQIGSHGHNLLKMLKANTDYPLPSIKLSKQIDRPNGKKLSNLAFQLCRGKKKAPSASQIGAFQLKFPEPVAGPIALGQSSHFGLGLFIPWNNA